MNLLLANFGEVLGYAGYVLLAVLVLLAMITVHEFGHYITGKIFGFGIEEFSIGFGPKLFSRRKKDGEVFSVRIFPLGGFCSFKGEDNDDADPSAFNNKSAWKRLIVLVSGALMNYLFALLIIIISFFSYGQTALVTYDLMDDPIYQTTAFEEKDVILKANGRNVYMVSDLMLAVENREAGDSVDFLVRRKGVDTSIKVTLFSDTYFSSIEDAQRLYDALGISYKMEDGQLVNGGLYQTGIKFGFFDTIGRSFEYSFRLAGTVFIVLKQLVTGAIGISSMGGTVTTIAVTAEAIKVGGLRYLLSMASLIGVNLAVFNLLPVPALDGSRVVFTAIEWARGKPISRRVEGFIHAVGLVLLLCFALLVDLQRCF